MTTRAGIELVDELLERRLRDDPAFRRAYHLDARFHAEIRLLRSAAVRAHDALVATGEKNADDMIGVLLAGYPDPQVAAERIAEHERRTWTLAKGPDAPTQSGV